MKHSELRVGNYVKCADGNTICIDKDDMIYILSNTFDVQPIPLSEDVMLKCPEIQPSTWMSEMWTIRDPKSQFHIVKMKGQFVFRGLGMSIVYVDTLHHLQNLVYVVSGEELEVSL